MVGGECPDRREVLPWITECIQEGRKGPYIEEKESIERRGRRDNMQIVVRQ